VVSMPAQQLQAQLRKAPNDGKDASRKLILDWDCKLTRESAAAALYEVWISELRNALLEKRVPAAVRKLVRAAILEDLIAEFLKTERAPDRDDLLRLTLSSAGDKMKKLQGDDPAKWSWGKLHVLRLRHGLDQRLPAALVDPPVVERPGDGFPVTATRGPASFEQTAGASYREVMDLGNWDHSVAINTPGQSGQPGSKHYADLQALWNDGRYFPLSYSRSAVNAATTDVLELTP